MKVRLSSCCIKGVKFKQGDYVYFFSKRLGVTVPARVEQVGFENIEDTVEEACLLIHANFATGDKVVWVKAYNCIFQEDYK